MATCYDIAAAANGELRLYLNTAGRIDLQRLQSALGYGYAHQREHRTPTDPWECAFGDARVIETEAMFDHERDRMIRVLLEHVSGAWEADLLYYPRGQSSAVYHWSSTEGTIRLSGVVNE